jgi:hypothetical protein
VTQSYFVKTFLILLLKKKQFASLQSLYFCILLLFKCACLFILLTSDSLTYMICYVFGLLTDLMLKARNIQLCLTIIQLYFKVNYKEMF